MNQLKKVCVSYPRVENRRRGDFFVRDTCAMPAGNPGPEIRRPHLPLPADNEKFAFSGPNLYSENKLRRQGTI